MTRRNDDIDFPRGRVEAREKAYSDASREDRLLDILYGADRPKCRVCGGRMDRNKVLIRCLFCGAPHKGVRG